MSVLPVWLACAAALIFGLLALCVALLWHGRSRMPNAKQPEQTSASEDKLASATDVSISAAKPTASEQAQKNATGLTQPRKRQVSSNPPEASGGVPSASGSFPSASGSFPTASSTSPAAPRGTGAVDPTDRGPTATGVGAPRNKPHRDEPSPKQANKLAPPREVPPSERRTTMESAPSALVGGLAGESASLGIASWPGCEAALDDGLTPTPPRTQSPTVASTPSPTPPQAAGASISTPEEGASPARGRPDATLRHTKTSESPEASNITERWPGLDLAADEAGGTTPPPPNSSPSPAAAAAGPSPAAAGPGSAHSAGAQDTNTQRETKPHGAAPGGPEGGPGRGRLSGGEKQGGTSQQAGPSGGANEHGAPEQTDYLELVVTAGPAKGTVVVAESKDQVLTIGRQAANTLALADNEVSGRHAQLAYDADMECWMVVDLGSLNGTLHNGTVINKSDRSKGTAQLLRHGDELTLGTVSRVRVGTTQEDGMKRPKKMMVDRASLGPGAPFLNLPPAVKFASKRFRLAGCCIQKVGSEHKRKGEPCEDVVQWKFPLPAHDDRGVICLFDGHGGREGCEQATDVVHRHVTKMLNSHAGGGGGKEGGEGGPGAAEPKAPKYDWTPEMEEAFISADREITSDEGCTATILLVSRADDGSLCLQAGNVGDSAALLANFEWKKMVVMTEDHRVSSPAEAARLAEMGARVSHGGTRIFGLNLARTLGDRIMKDEGLGIIATPHVSPPITLGPEDGGVLLLASDGLWDVLPHAAAVKAAYRAWREDPHDAEAMAQRLMMSAIQNRSKDDITIAVVQFAPASEAAAWDDLPDADFVSPMHK